MPAADSMVEKLVSYCKREFGDPSRWINPDGYPDSLALCIIDAIYSTGSNYHAVVNVINRYKSSDGASDKDGVTALLESFDRAGGGQRWAKEVADNNRPVNNLPGAKRKAEVIEEAAKALKSLGIETVQDLRAKLQPDLKNNPVRDFWLKLPSQSSGVTYNYLLILAGEQSVKPDRWVLKFLDDVLDEGKHISECDAVELVSRAAEKLGVEPRKLDHIIWREASGREKFIDEEQN